MIAKPRRPGRAGAGHKATTTGSPTARLVCLRAAPSIEGCKSHRRRLAATGCKDLRFRSTAASVPPTAVATRLRWLSRRLIPLRCTAGGALPNRRCGSGC